MSEPSMNDALRARLERALAERYRLVRELGQGGMATVYLADDLKHERQVAIKVLKPQLAAVIGGERFVAEIKTTAALQHPHILPLFDSGAADGFLYYVMPFVEGESLREKLDRERQLDVDEAVRIVAAVASALHYAHEHGVVHRDIKPANILLQAGEPVVADFGIALALSAAGGGRLTETGMSIGTPHYMSPEQASADRDVGARSDQYALAAVLYEMLAGTPPHSGPTAQAVLMRILTHEPTPLPELRASVPEHVADAVTRALQKLPADRFKSAAAFKEALQSPAFRWTAPVRVGQGDGATAGSRSGAGGSTAGWATDVRTWALGAATLVLLAAVGWLGLRGSETAAPMARVGTGNVHQYGLTDPALSDPWITLSPGGDLVYSASDSGRIHLRVHRASEPGWREIANTEGGTGPVVSPDGEWVAFTTRATDFGGGELRKVQLVTGTEVTLLPRGQMEGIWPSQWTDEGDIVFTSRRGAFRISEAGGVPDTLATFDDDVLPYFAHLVPDGRTLLLTVADDDSAMTARVLQYDVVTGDTLTLVPEGGPAFWSPTGHVVHGSPGGTLFALPFDLDAHAPRGPPVPVREAVLTLGSVSAFALSPRGTLAYMRGTGTGSDISDRSFHWLDLEGAITPLAVEATDHGDAALSPDGRYLAYIRHDHIHVADLETGADQRLTFGNSTHHDPVWSPGGERVAFSSDRDGGAGSYDIWVKTADGRSDAVRIGGTPRQDYVYQWLPGDTLVGITRIGAGPEVDVVVLPGAGPETEVVALLDAEWEESSPRVSPDGSLVAYISEESGEPHVYVREFPDLGGRWQISEDPALGPVLWARDGATLVYQRGADEAVMRADIERAPGLRVADRSIVRVAGPPVVLRAVHPDGDRILLTMPRAAEVFGGQEGGLIVVANWFSDLLERVGEAG